MAYRNVPASARAGLTARVMLVALIVPAVAPALGGWLVDSLSWRGIFFASVAPALLVLALAMRWLPRHKHAAQRLDLRGLLLGSAALATLLVALAWLGSPGGGGRGLLLALLACVLGCCYWRDGRARTDALLDLACWRRHCCVRRCWSISACREPSWAPTWSPCSICKAPSASARAVPVR